MKNQKIINDIDGLIVVNKEKGYTSNDVINVIKKFIHPKKIGHTGTLDPNATGVLVTLLGDATKSQEYLMKNGIKEYEAELILGIATDSEDITGNIIDLNENVIHSVICDAEEFDRLYNKVIDISKSFIGEYDQVPPMYSAKKVDGKKLVDIARKGREIERQPSKVIIYDISITGIATYNIEKDGENIPLKAIKIKVSCSKGTYIRTLCKDIGAKLNLNSCMGNLKRLKNSCFDIKDSVTIGDINNKLEDNDYSFIKPCYYMDRDSVVTFGKFETLHLGHQAIISETVAYAKSNNLQSIAMIVGDNEDCNVLTKEQRVSRLKALGIDKILYYKLNDVNRFVTPISFINDILYNEMRAKAIIVGTDCRFGYKGAGDVELLKNECEKLGIKVKIIDKLKVEGTDIDISSTYVKEQYDKGNITLVDKLLGK